MADVVIPTRRSKTVAIHIQASHDGSSVESSKKQLAVILHTCFSRTGICSLLWRGGNAHKPGLRHYLIAFVRSSSKTKVPLQFAAQQCAYIPFFHSPATNFGLAFSILISWRLLSLTKLLASHSRFICSVGLRWCRLSDCQTIKAEGV